MPRTAKNIYKRKDGRGKQDIRLARRRMEIPNMLLYMHEVIPKLRSYSKKRKSHE